jgi:hypothetical protein
MEENEMVIASTGSDQKVRIHCEYFLFSYLY